MATLTLTGRSSSHYTRVAAMFAHELGLPFELVVVHQLTHLDPANYGGHPALKLPTLHVGGTSVFGTEHICRTLVELAGRAHDPRVVLSERVGDALTRNAQELVWQVMAAQVQVRVGVAVARLPEDNVFFTKAAAGMSGALAWLDQRLEQVLHQLPAPRDLSLLEVTLFCLMEHLAFLPTVPLDPHTRLRDFASTFAGRASAQQTGFRFDPRPKQEPQ